MKRAKALLVLSAPMIVVVLLNGVVAPAQPAGNAASKPAAAQPAYPLWDGKESVADYAKRAGIKDVQITLALDGNVTMKLTLIPAGRFTMGSPAGEPHRYPNEGPQREVTITKRFHMGVYTVTQEQYEHVMGKNPSWFKGARNPVETTSWNEAAEFCLKVSQKTGKKVSLPTEAQWEYACRAGSKSRFSFGEDANNLGDYAWFRLNSEGKTHPVGQKKPNGWGLFDMQGNVMQWSADWYGPYANAGKTDPSGPASGGSLEARVERGSTFQAGADDCRSAIRPWWVGPALRADKAGFRISVDLK